jgi:hypothetical protein
MQHCLAVSYEGNREHKNPKKRPLFVSFLRRGLRNGAGSAEHVVGLEEDGGREREPEESREMLGVMPLSGSPRPQGPCPDTSA